MSKKKKPSNGELLVNFENVILSDKEIPNIDLTGKSFKGAILKRCDFSNRDLSFVDFSSADLYSANFSGAKLYSTIFKNADLTRANFANADLYGIKLFDCDVTRSVFDSTINTELNAKSHEDYNKASDIYNTLKRAFQSHGEITNASHYYYKQQVCKRKSKNNSISKFLEYIFFDLFFGYGEKPLRTIYVSIVTVFFFGIIYFLLPLTGLGDIVDTSYLINSCNNLTISIAPENNWSLTHFLKAMEFSTTSFIGASIINWDLFGYARIINTFQSLIGLILISMVIIGFSRKIIRM